jgi:hypothetical protein
MSKRLSGKIMEAEKADVYIQKKGAEVRKHPCSSLVGDI